MVYYHIPNQSTCHMIPKREKKILISILVGTTYCI